MTDDSFTYNGVDLYEQFGIRVVAYNLLMPERRRRSVVVPGRSGSFNYDDAPGQSTHHNDRPLRMTVVIERELAPGAFDDLKYTLSRQGRIVLWDQPDRYYRGNLFDPAEVLDYFRHSMREFELVFLCDPYAYALTPTTLVSGQSILPMRYEGTRETPTRIKIRNTGKTPLTGIRVIAREVT